MSDTDKQQHSDYTVKLNQLKLLQESYRGKCLRGNALIWATEVTRI